MLTEFTSPSKGGKTVLSYRLADLLRPPNKILVESYRLDATNTENSRHEAIVPTPAVKAQTDD